MFPSHPHAGAWHEAAVKYMMNTLSTGADLRDTSMVDGRAVTSGSGVRICSRTSRWRTTIFFIPLMSHVVLIS
jgi:hypothetical protein